MALKMPQIGRRLGRATASDGAGVPWSAMIWEMLKESGGV